MGTRRNAYFEKRSVVNEIQIFQAIIPLSEHRDVSQLSHNQKTPGHFEVRKNVSL